MRKAAGKPPLRGTPYVIRKIWEYGAYIRDNPAREETKQRAEEIVAGWVKAGAETQPFVTRPARTGGQQGLTRRCSWLGESAWWLGCKVTVAPVIADLGR